MYMEAIKRVLGDAGIDVYMLEQHAGECESPYVVVEEGGEYPGFSYHVVIVSIDFTVYYPVADYDGLAAYIRHVKEALKAYRPITPTREQSPVRVDPEAKAYTVSFDYELHLVRR